MKSDEQQIRDVIDRWRIATTANDLDTILSLMTDDALFLTPGKPPMTKDGFAAAFRGFAGNVRIESKHDIHEIYASGDLAYCRSHISVVATAAKTGERNERSGHVLTVFRKSADGKWRLARDANLIGGTAG
jgi:uncharacterized protein (TIGR02246 family)